MNWETLRCTLCERIFHVPDQFYRRVSAECYLCERCEEVSALFGHIYALHIVGKRRDEVEIVIKALQERETSTSLSYHNVQINPKGWSGTYWFYNGISAQLIILLRGVTCEYRLVDMSTGEIALSFLPKTDAAPSGALSHLLL